MDVSEVSRFSVPALLILASLAGGPKHGYAMMGEIQETYGVHLGPGTLYGALVRLERSGLIEAHPSEDTRRRPYQLTGLGAKSLREYLARMQKIVAIGQKRLASE